MGIITRDRPGYLRALLTSLQNLNGFSFERIFVIVENNGTFTVGTLVRDFANSVRDPVLTECEEQIGISFARNRVLEIACREEADLLAFVDDDETVHPDWLQRLVAEKLERNLDIVGGPARLHPPSPNLDWWHHAVWRGCLAIKRRSEERAIGLLAKDRDGTVPLATNNWLADLNFLRSERLRFDEQLGLTGGEDTRLFLEAKARGAKTGWSPGAIVFEMLPAERLTFEYQYRRSRDRSVASFHAKYPTRSWNASQRAVFSAIGKSLLVPIFCFLAAFDRGASFVHAARAWGYAVGRLQAAVGQRSEHYISVTGR